MSISDFDIHNAFLAHQSIDGVRYEYNDFVRIVSGEYSGEKGSVISVEQIEPHVIFLIERESGFDAYLRQSDIELIARDNGSET